MHVMWRRHSHRDGGQPVFVRHDYIRSRGFRYYLLFSFTRHPCQSSLNFAKREWTGSALCQNIWDILTG